MLLMYKDRIEKRIMNWYIDIYAIYLFFLVDLHSSLAFLTATNLNEH